MQISMRPFENVPKNKPMRVRLKAENIIPMLNIPCWSAQQMKVQSETLTL